MQKLPPKGYPDTGQNPEAPLKNPGRKMLKWPHHENRREEHGKNSGMAK